MSRAVVIAVTAVGLVGLIAASQSYNAPDNRWKPSIQSAQASRADDPDKPQEIPGGIGAARIKKDSLVCTTLRGLETVSYNMNANQMESIGCVRAGSDIPVKMQDPYSYELNQRVTVYFPKQVVSYWVRVHSLKDR